MKDVSPAVAISPRTLLLDSKMLAQLPVFCSVGSVSIFQVHLVSKSPSFRALLLISSIIACPSHSRDHYPQYPVSNTEKTLLGSAIVNSAPVEGLKRTLQETLPAYGGNLRGSEEVMVSSSESPYKKNTLISYTLISECIRALHLPRQGNGNLKNPRTTLTFWTNTW